VGLELFSSLGVMLQKRERRYRTCKNQKGRHIGEEEATERGWRW
jgi:hypothetical protein